jgi:hypothetical protein
MPTFSKNYLLDSDVLGHAQERSDHESIFDGIVAGVKDGKVKTVRQVLGELKKFKIAFSKLNLHKAAFEVSAGLQYCPEVSDVIEKITNAVGDLFQQLGGKNPDPADPWLIAVAKVHNFTLVTDESPYSPKRIPAICKLSAISCPCIRGPQFLIETGIVSQMDPAHIDVHAFYGLHS